MCNERNIEVIFFTCPYEDPYNYSEAMKDYAKNNNCAYIDFFELKDEVGIDGEKDFKDEGHLNTEGAAKIARYLADFIVANYDVPNSIANAQMGK